jgi:hypothetical protein
MIRRGSFVGPEKHNKTEHPLAKTIAINPDNIVRQFMLAKGL